MTHIAEQYIDQTAVPHVPLREGECSYIDEQITTALQQYVESIHNEERRQFRALPSLTNKIDYICWVWGQNPETYDGSINLKSLLAIRTLEDTIVRPEESSRTYHMPVQDPYWAAVDRKVYDHFSTYVASETTHGILPYEALTKETPSTICVMQDHLIARMHDKADMVRYAAIPLNKIGEIAQNA